MICQRCLFRLERPSLALGRRAYASASVTSSSVSHNPKPNTAAPRGPATEEHEGRPAATSTSAAQPFSASEGPARPGTSPKVPSLGPSGTMDQIESLPRKKSKTPAGQPLTGLGYFKNKDPPVALEDHEYPPWLWTLLDFGDKGNTDMGQALEGNIWSKSKAQRRKAAKAARKIAKQNPGQLLPKVPIEHQTVDLPHGDGSVEGSIGAVEVRETLTSAMRSRRRKAIKESNYLKGMR